VTASSNRTAIELAVLITSVCYATGETTITPWIYSVDTEIVIKRDEPARVVAVDANIVWTSSVAHLVGPSRRGDKCPGATAAGIWTRRCKG